MAELVVAAGAWRIDALGVFHRREIVRPLGLDDDGILREGQGIEDEHLELIAVRRTRFVTLPGGVDVGHLLVGEVEGKAGALVAAAAETVDEVAVENVDRDAAGAEAEFPIGSGRVRESFGQVAVFHDQCLAVLLAEDADLFTGVGLRHHLRREVGLVHEVESDEGGIEAAHEGIVDLEIADRIDAIGLHLPDRTGPHESAQGSAVAIGTQGDLTLLRHEDFPLGVDRGHETLGEEVNALFFQTEIIISLEEGNGLFVIEDRGHEIPGNGTTVDPAGGEDLFGKDLEEGFAQNRGDAVGALRSIKAEACALASGDGESSNASGAEGGFSLQNGLTPEAGIGVLAMAGQGKVIGGFEAFEEGIVLRTTALDEGFVERSDLGEVDGPGLLEEGLLFGGGKGVEMGEDVALSVGFVVGAEIGHGCRKRNGSPWHFARRVIANFSSHRVRFTLFPARANGPPRRRRRLARSLRSPCSGNTGALQKSCRWGS